MRHVITTLSALALVALAGCATHNGVTTAHPIGEGNVQVAVEPGAVIAGAAGVSAVIPSFNLAVRYGLSDRAEIGGRLGTGAYEVLGKVQLNGLDSDIPISIAPSGNVWFMGAGGAGFGWFNYQIPVLFGIPVGEHQLVLGPKVGQYIFFGGGSGASAGGTVISTGGGVGFSLKLGDKFRLHPELALTLPVLGAVGASAGGSSAGGATAGIGGTAVGINVGLLFGGN